MALLAAAFAAAPLTASEHPHHWSYSGEDGPSHWSELDPKFAACVQGKNQSPIDIHTADAKTQALASISFEYQPTVLHIIDNGHTVQVDVDKGSWLEVGGKKYQLVQFHFHHPSEERINGRAFDMVAHLVHKDPTGELAVVAVEITAGKENATIAELWRHLPKQKEHEEDFQNVRINPAGLLPANRGYFTYSGSLTTPPCTEGVRWFVIKSPLRLSKAEITTFANLYPNDARPVQKLNGRVVLSGH